MEDLKQTDHIDIPDDLNLSFQEQCFMQLAKLELKMASEHPVATNKAKHRLFRSNVYEDIKPSERQHLEMLLVGSLKALGTHLHQSLAPGPGLKNFAVIDKRRQCNYIYDKRGVIHLKSREDIKFGSCRLRKQALLLHLVAKILTLLQTDRYVTNRELYYMSKELCQSRPNKISAAIDDLCCLLGCSRIHLRVICQSKGIIYGNLNFKLKNGEQFDCLVNREGTSLPTPQIPIVELNSDAKFILIIEKDSVLQRMLNQENKTNFVKKYKAILFTAKGYPDINSRAFINFLWTKLRIPIFALTDADPHGLEIVCCYKFGCYQTASESSYLAVPQLRWLGLLPSDVARHAVPDSRTLSHSESDIRKINSLYARPYLKNKPDWIHQLDLMRESKRKAEIESLDSDGEYLGRTYLPNKIRYASWLD